MGCFCSVSGWRSPACKKSICWTETSQHTLMKCQKPLVSVAVGLQPDLQRFFLLSPSTLCRFDWCEVVSASRAGLLIPGAHSASLATMHFSFMSFFLDFFFHANELHHYLSGAGNLKAVRVTVFLPRAGVLGDELNTFATKNRYKFKCWNCSPPKLLSCSLASKLTGGGRGTK